jgi:hypothetical protein
LHVQADELYRFAISISFSTGGEFSPIFHTEKAFKTLNAAKDAAVRHVIERLPKRTFAGDPQSFAREIADLRGQVERYFAQPSLF